MTIKELINKWNEKLKLNNIEDSLLKIRLLLAEELNVSKEYLLINAEQLVEKDIIEKFEKKIKLILENEPFQYILGYQEFMKMRFYVEKRCINS